MREPPPPRPRGLPAPHYVSLDGTNVYVVQGQSQAPSPRLNPPRDPGPGFTHGEEMLDRYLRSVGDQLHDAFDWNETPEGDLRQYWCPHCEEPTSTVAKDFHCEHCGEWFNVADIEDQIAWLIERENPQVVVPYAVAEFLYGAFYRILYSTDSRDALKLKPGRKRVDLPRYYVQRHAAELVHERLTEMSKTQACNEVAGLFAERMPKGDLDGRTVANWYDRFYSEK